MLTQICAPVIIMLVELTLNQFFISDAIPITEKYIAREYIGYDNSIHIIKNPNLISELNRKLGRILAFENSKPNYFRQKLLLLKLI